MSLQFSRALSEGLPRTSEITNLGAVAAREKIAAAFAEAGHAISQAGELDTQKKYHLVVWSEDYYNVTKVFAVPEGALSAELHEAFSKADCTGYAFHEIMGGVDYGEGLLRIDCAMGQADWEDMLSDYEDESPGIADKIPESERDCMEPYLIASVDAGDPPKFVEGGFDKHFVSTHVSRRSM